MIRLRSFLSALRPTRLGVLFAVLVGLGVGFWQWNRPPRPRLVLEDIGSRSFGLPGAFFSPDGRKVAVFHKDPGDLHSFFLTLWDAQTGQKEFDLFTPPAFHPGPVKGPEGISCWEGAVFSPDAKKIACLFQRQINNLEDDREGKIHVWNVANGKELASIEEKDASARLAFSSQGKLLALRHGSLWDVADNKKLKKIVLEGEEILGSRVNLILVRSKDNFLKVWNLATGTLIAEQPENLNLGKDDKRFWRWMSDRFFVIFPGDSDKVYLFDLFTGQKKQFNKEHSPIAVSADGQMIAVDNFVVDLSEKSWSVGLLEWLGIQQPFSAHYVTLRAIPSGAEIIVLKDCMYPSFAPDGKTLVVIGSDHSLQLWDLPIRKPIGRILGLAGLAAVATLLAFNGLGRLRRRRSKEHALLIASGSAAQAPIPETKIGIG